MSRSATDPFDTASLRAAVLEAWRSSPTRYREDANVEEDYARGAYRDRLVVELAQNAADAARAAGVPCRMHISLDRDAMVVANTGAPLSVAGVQSMAAMRASAKSDEGVGRFGVGFAATLSVTDAPTVVSRDGGVRFSKSDTADVMRSDPKLAALLQQREPPVLRLPFPHDTTVANHAALAGDYDTVVVLPWRDQQAHDLAVPAVESIDDALFIALPDLVELVVESRIEGSTTSRRWTVSRDEDTVQLSVDSSRRRWKLFETTGRWSNADLDDAPAEERARSAWRLTWAVPVTDSGEPTDQIWSDPDAAPGRVVHAPTPTDEPLALPALLVGDFPVDASRRRLRAGAMVDVMVDAAIASYADVVRRWAGTRDVEAIQLVPQADLVGTVDGRIRLGVREALERTPWVRRASDAALVAPHELVTVEPTNDALARVLAPHVFDLVASEWLAHVKVLRALGVVTWRWADVWDLVAGMRLPSETWHAVYEAASDLDAASLEGLPVLLTTGRLVRDARRCVVPRVAGDEADEALNALITLGLSVVDPRAMHPLLERMGARPFDPRVHLGDDFVARVDAAVEVAPSEARDLLRAAAFALDAAGVGSPVAELGNVLVPTANDEWRPATQVAMPGSALAAHQASSLVLDTTLAGEHRDGWLALGVLDSLAVVEVTELPLDPERWDALMPEGADWCDDVASDLGSRTAGELLATSVRIVRGLPFLDRMPLEQVLPLLAVPGVRAAVVEPAFILDGAGTSRAVRSPASWWLADVPLFEGRPAVAVRLPGDDRLAPFFAEVVAPTDTELLQAIGVHTTLDAWLQTPGGVSELLDAMADDDVDIPGDIIGQLYRAVDDASPDVDDVDPPVRLRALVDESWHLIDADEVLVARAPHHAAVLGRAFIPGSDTLAEVLDVDGSDDAACGAAAVQSTGLRHEVPQVVCQLTSVTDYYEHDQLTVGGRDTDWWVTDTGEVHACTVAGLARGLAWTSGQWQLRWEIEAKLSGTDDIERARVESFYDR
jgi:hypothetical protein